MRNFVLFANYVFKFLINSNINDTIQADIFSFNLICIMSKLIDK